MTAGEWAAITPPQADDEPLPGRRFWQRAATAIGRWLARSRNHRRDCRDLRILSKRALRDIGLEPDDFDYL